MSRKPSVQSLTPALRQEAEELRRSGATLQEVRAFLLSHEEDISISTLGRYFNRSGFAAAQIQESRVLARVLAKPLEHQDDLVTVNLELLHACLYRVMSSAGRNVELETGEVTALANALQKLLSAEKAHKDLTRAAIAEAREEQTRLQAEQLEVQAGSLGLDGQTVTAIKQRILFGESSQASETPPETRATPENGTNPGTDPGESPGTDPGAIPKQEETAA